MSLDANDRIDDALSEARDEVIRAVSKHGSFNSHHEAYGVLLEEVEEYFDEVKKQSGKRSKKRLREELIQIAAVAIKAAHSLT